MQASLLGFVMQLDCKFEATNFSSHTMLLVKQNFWGSAQSTLNKSADILLVANNLLMTRHMKHQYDVCIGTPISDH